MLSNENVNQNPKDLIGSKKAGMSMVPSCVLAEIGVAMTEGGLKYGKFNFRASKIRSSVYYDAVLRHLFSFWEGEDIDPDSGLCHLTKAIASLVVWRDAMMQGMMIDDRPPCSAAFYPELNALASKILERNVDRSPRHYTIADGLTEHAALEDDARMIADSNAGAA